MRILFFLRKIGPYHHARFEAVKSEELIVVETRPESQEYAWKFKAEGKYAIKKLPISTNPEVGIKSSQLKVIVSSLFEKYQPDVVVTTGWADREYHIVVLEANKRNIPKVVISDSRYEDEPRKFYKEFIKRMLLSSYGAALVAGTSSRNYLLQLGYSNKDIFYPWDVVDNTYFDKQEDKYFNFLQRDFVCVSRFISKKNLEGLIDAFSEYRKRGGARNLVLLGSGELEATLKRRVNDYKLEKFISFEGFAQYEILPDYLHRSFFLILPSWSDQWGLVVNEAMASGLPVIVSNRCGCAEDLVKNGVNGYIFDPYTKNELVDKMKAADLLDGITWKEMCEKAKYEIKIWGLNDFAEALSSACSHAIKYPTKRTYNTLHRLLSR